MEHFVIQMPIIGAPLSQPGRMLPDDAQRVHHNAALCKEAANWLTRHPDARGGRAPLNVSRVSFPPPKIKLCWMAKGWASPGTYLLASRGSKRSPGRAEIATTSISAVPCPGRDVSCTARPRPKGVLGSSHPANAPHSPGCKVCVVQGGSDPTAPGIFIASICDDRFYKQIPLHPLDSNVAEGLSAPFKVFVSIVGSDF